jgi:hypothetical protein
MPTLLSDIRYGARMLIRRPGLNALAILALALGIGLTTTMFSIVYMAVLKGLPFPDADRLVALFRTRPAQGLDQMPVSIHDFVDWRAQQTSFEDVAAYFAGTVNVSGTEGRPVRYLGSYASAHLFDVLRVRCGRGVGLITHAVPARASAQKPEHGAAADARAPGIPRTLRGPSR